ncbi:MAG: HAD family hydrolase [Mangrovibacterium sp.]
MPVKNIIFDLGGVLLQIDPTKTLDAFKKLGMIEADTEIETLLQNQVFRNLEQGRMENDEFRNNINQMLPEKVDEQLIDDAWNAMLLNFIDERVQLVRQLRQDYKVFLFSNTNQIHKQFFQDLFFKNYHFALSELFDNDFYSHEVGLRKPNEKAFEKVIMMADINPHETLFVDDLIENCRAAERLGMKSLCLLPTSDTEYLLNYLQLYNNN